MLGPWTEDLLSKSTKWFAFSVNIRGNCWTLSTLESQPTYENATCIYEEET